MENVRKLWLSRDFGTWFCSIETFGCGEAPGYINKKRNSVREILVLEGGNLGP